MSTVIDLPSDFLKIEPGTHFGFSEWLLIEQDRINEFANATGDHQWIHVDPEKSKHGPFGTTIAHGFMTASLAYNFLMETVVVERTRMALNYGTDRVRFPASVPVNSRVRGGCTLLSAETVKDAVKVVIEVAIEVEGGTRPACIIDTILLYYPEA